MAGQLLMLCHHGPLAKTDPRVATMKRRTKKATGMRSRTRRPMVAAASVAFAAVIAFPLPRATGAAIVGR